jgi:hypothetical protein
MKYDGCKKHGSQQLTPEMGLDGARRKAILERKTIEFVTQTKAAIVSIA